MGNNILDKINQQLINDSCLKDAGKLLSSDYCDWKPSNPTYGYCYLVSEAIYHISEEILVPHIINLGSRFGVHWFLKYNDAIIDYTANQFNFSLDYKLARKCEFLNGSIETDKGFISIRGNKFLQYLM